ncbi:MAG TPA: hypothetical protein O0X39_02055 [Methanocorpusculum sp.]|nr:hypothetical protein [Methanocorpusculum sp.]
MAKQDASKTPFPKGRAHSAFPPGKKTAAKPSSKQLAKPAAKSPADDFAAVCMTYLAAHKERFGEVKKSAVPGFAFECVRRGTNPPKMYHVAVTSTQNAGAAVVEKTAEKLEKMLEGRAPDGFGHQAVIMAQGVFAAEAQSAAITCNVLLLPGRTMAK